MKYPKIAEHRNREQKKLNPNNPQQFAQKNLISTREKLTGHLREKKCSYAKNHKVLSTLIEKQKENKSRRPDIQQGKLNKKNTSKKYNIRDLV